MHNIEPFFKWREEYIAAEDRNSPFYRRKYSEFEYTNKIYNHLIHPQWDKFGSETLLLKILFTDYEDGYTIIELLGEWNDAIANDILTLKKFVLNRLAEHGINKYIFVGENLLNFHADSDDYYEEWYEDVSEEDGWIVFLNITEHVMDEMKEARLHHYINFGKQYNEVNWRIAKPEHLYDKVLDLMNSRPKLLK